MDLNNRPYEMADVLGFVRRDLSASVLRADVEHIRGTTRNSATIPAPRPASILNQLSGYVRTCMRDAHHFQNEGQALMVLSWAEALAGHLFKRGAPSPIDDDMMRLASGLESIERVQRIEKSRFFRLWERLPGGPMRERLNILWSQSYSRPVEQ
jgi:hypothetical protein